MNQLPSPELLETQWNFLSVILMIVAISFVLGVNGGWASLAKKFRARDAVRGERFRFVSGQMGASFMPVWYRNCLSVTVNEAGFGLSIFFLSRLFSPPLFIPWGDVESVTTKQTFLSSSTAIRIRGHWPTITLRGKAGEHIKRHHERAAVSKMR